VGVNDTNTLAAYNSTNQTLVLVCVNNRGHRFKATYNLNAFAATPARAAVFQTTRREHLAALDPLPVVNHQFIAAIPARSVTTFVLTNVTLP
jgi:O-glycosyl hydrolase